jgi:hypothetical protein
MGVQNALRAQREEARRDAAVKEQLRARLFDEDMRRQEFEQRKRDADEQRQFMNDQREALAEQRRTNRANQVASNIGIGDVLDDEQVGILRGGGLGSNVERQGATLPSQQTTGYLRTTAVPGAGNRPQFGAGRLIVRSLQGNPERDVWRGTPIQRRESQQDAEQRRIIAALPANHPARLALEYEAATGKGAPASMFPSQGDTTPFQLQPLYEDGLPTGAIRFNQRTGAVEPVDLGGAGIRAGRGGRAQLPARVQNWILQLQQRHPNDYASAQREFAEVMQNAPNETFDRMAAAQALRGLYAQPTGMGDAWMFAPEAQAVLGALGGGMQPSTAPLTGGRGGVPPGAMQQPAQAGSGAGRTRTTTRAAAREVAKRLGISEADAVEQLRQEGVEVR